MTVIRGTLYRLSGEVPLERVSRRVRVRVDQFFRALSRCLFYPLDVVCRGRGVKIKMLVVNRRSALVVPQIV